MIPKFAVVGHPNKGKSSIVSTLAEDPRVAIAPMPGTTISSRSFPLRIDGEVIYELIDTPGFQRPREVLAWLEHQCSDATDRAQAVSEFVNTHRDDPRFHDECELLQPLLGGAGILYVVDGSRPYGSEFEAEMEILRFTGQPRMALINMIGGGDHSEPWRRALDQYFSIVRIFDPLHADADKRLALLASFGELHAPWRDAIDKAVAALRADYRRRRQRAAHAIGGLISAALSMSETDRIEESTDKQALIEKLERKLKARLRAQEKTTRGELESIYRHTRLEWQSLEETPINSDLFSRESERLFGLSRGQLVASGAVSGAIAGTSVDVILGGSSLFLFGGISAIVGGVSALFGSERLLKQKILGQTLGSRDLQVGPFRDPNLPWILLGRALLFHDLISERNHAARDALIVDAAREQHRSNNISDSLRRKLTAVFDEVRDGKTGANEKLFELIAATLQEHDKAQHA